MAKTSQVIFLYTRGIQFLMANKQPKQTPLSHEDITPLDSSLFLTHPNILDRLHLWMEGLGLPKWFIQLILFGFIGVSGLIVDGFVVVLCREAFGIDVRYGMFPAFFVAVCWNFELNRRITFRAKDINITFAFIAFFLTALVGLAIRWPITNLFIENLKMNGERFLTVASWKVPYLRLSYIAYFIGIVAAYVINFLGSKFVAFRKQNQNK